MHPTTLRAFFRAILSSWFLGMSGSLSVPLTVAAVFVPNEIAKVLLGITAFACFWGAAFAVWRREREARKSSDAERASLAERLSSKISISVEGNGILTIPVSSGALSKWAQIVVQSHTDVALEECEVWVRDIKRLSPGDADMVSIVDEAARCEWSQRGGAEQHRLTIRPGIRQRANLFKILEEETPTPIPHPTLDFVKILLQIEIEHPSRYRIYLAVTAKDAPTELASFIFDWKNFENVSLTQERAVSSSVSARACAE